MVIIRPVITDPLIVEYQGVTIACSTADQAVEVARKLAGEISSKSSRPRVISKASPILNQSWPYSAEEEQIALDFLTTIQDAARHGADSEKIRKAVRAESPKGIGGRSVMINGMLRHLGIVHTNVYSNDRTPNVGRFWKPNKLIHDAITAIKSKMKEE